MTDTMIALVTGANKGIGREIAAQLAALGHTVVIGSRSADLGEQAAAELRAAGGDAVAVVLDVTDPTSVAAAADTVEARFGRLDALINNAGVSHRPGSDFSGQLPRSANVDDVRFVFETNVFGVITVTSAFLPLLRRSSAPRIVNVSSSAGSLALMSDPALADQNPIALGYVPSKTALTAMTIQYARDLASEHILVNAVCPGFVATDLNNHAGVRAPSEGAASAVRMATITADGPTGTFTDDQGPVPW
jgi:NAD(P)-dependent dehydrogenase (short-subunit alcohol dehydrogenase family)